jgi:hypothetical protein
MDCWAWKHSFANGQVLPSDRSSFAKFFSQINAQPHFGQTKNLPKRSSFSINRTALQFGHATFIATPRK